LRYTFRMNIAENKKEIILVHVTEKGISVARTAKELKRQHGAGRVKKIFGHNAFGERLHLGYKVNNTEYTMYAPCAVPSGEC
jgi:hypothetical protein